MTANQLHITSRPDQVRCSSQPMGLRSSLWRIQRRRKPAQITGVHNFCSSHSRRADLGSSCQTRRSRQAANPMADTSIRMDRMATNASEKIRPGFVPVAELKIPAHQPPKSVAAKNPAGRIWSLGTVIRWYGTDQYGRERDGPARLTRVKPVRKIKPKAKQPPSSQAMIWARSQDLASDEASNPAESAQQMALKLTSMETRPSFQPTPPNKKGTVIIGNAASHRVNARRPWTRPLARTMSLALSGVMKRRPSVPSRLSRLRQSAARTGTSAQMEMKSVQLRQPNNSPPRSAGRPKEMVNSRLK